MMSLLYLLMMYAISAMALPDVIKLGMQTFHNTYLAPAQYFLHKKDGNITAPAHNCCLVNVSLLVFFLAPALSLIL